jgi:hypothetical protein
MRLAGFCWTVANLAMIAKGKVASDTLLIVLGSASTIAALGTWAFGVRARQFAGPVFIMTATARLIQCALADRFSDLIFDLGMTLGIIAIYYGNSLAAYLKRLLPIRLPGNLKISARRVALYICFLTYAYEFSKESTRLYVQGDMMHNTEYIISALNILFVILLFIARLMVISALMSTSR